MKYHSVGWQIYTIPTLTITCSLITNIIILKLTSTFLHFVYWLHNSTPRLHTEKYRQRNTQCERGLRSIGGTWLALSMLCRFCWFMVMVNDYMLFLGKQIYKFYQLINLVFKNQGRKKDLIHLVFHKLNSIVILFPIQIDEAQVFT